ncbi:hypothetical protein WR25_26444 [Diploscapter pachys]|uniref:Repulsive guidance molecule C-terminal domain-containing protein n=1 Tax=Diploscapter pachys TaxID=2018661 RepID=A0A2A2JXN8_9BILA|nr:hypothetical protein WR25_26444 [Diploscapter pachys]
MRKDWREYGCAKMNLARSHGNRCHFLPPSSHRLVRYCALFGDPHLLRFDGTFETCSEEGARPLVENRYFLIQVTNANVHGAHLTTSVNKVTVLIREHNCTSRLRYEAAAETKRLSDAFVDGTTHVSVDQHKHSVELLRQDPDYVELRLRYIDTSIHLRRQGPYLSVAVRAPLHVLQTADSTAYQLCWAGCRKSDVIPVTKAINATSEFANCYQRKIHVPVKLATDRCKSLSENLTGSFLDACIFDFMLTGLTPYCIPPILCYSRRRISRDDERPCLFGRPSSLPLSTFLFTSPSSGFITLQPMYSRFSINLPTTHTLHQCIPRNTGTELPLS